MQLTFDLSLSKTEHALSIKMHDGNIQASDLSDKYDGILFDMQNIVRDHSSIHLFNGVTRPLRIVLGELSAIDRNWKFLTDEFRRNIMFLTTDFEAKENPDMVSFLESQGVALLSARQTADGNIDLKSMLKSLASLKLKSILVEGTTRLLAEFIKQGLVN